MATKETIEGYGDLVKRMRYEAMQWIRASVRLEKLKPKLQAQVVERLIPHFNNCLGLDIELTYKAVFEVIVDESFAVHGGRARTPSTDEVYARNERRLAGERRQKAADGEVLQRLLRLVAEEKK